MKVTFLKDKRLLGEIKQYLRVKLHLKGIFMAKDPVYSFEGWLKYMKIVIT